MTFADLLTTTPALDLATLRGLWLVLPAEVNAAMLAKQDAHGSPVHRVAPIAGPDGRFALCADLVTEIRPGGIHHALFASFDAATFSAVAIATRAELETAGWFAAPPEDIA